MDQKLRALFDEIEQQRQGVAIKISTIDESQAQRSIRPDFWSVSQIIEHLVLCDETLGRAVDSRVVEAEPALYRLIPRSWRFALVIDALNKNVKMPLPTPLVNPAGAVPMRHLLLRWERAREGMLADLNWLTADDLRYFHPALGLLTAKQILELGRAHTAYHLRQIEFQLKTQVSST